MEHANTAVRLLLPLFSLIIVAMILTARRRPLFIRRIQGLSAIDEAVGRATEMGRPMLCCNGLGGTDVTTLQALSIISYIIRSSAKFGTRAIVPVYQPTTLPIAMEIVQDAYAAEELVAELGAAFLCADLALASEPRPDHAAYVQSWLKVLRNDKRAIFTAAAKAQVAADYAHERAGHLHSARAGASDQRAA